MAEHYLSHDCQYAFGGRYGGSSADSPVVIIALILRRSVTLSLAGLGFAALLIFLDGSSEANIIAKTFRVVIQTGYGNEYLHRFCRQ